MKKPWYQKAILYFSWFLAAFFFVGSILDTIANSLVLITYKVSYIGSVVIIVVLVLIELSLRMRPLRWITRDKQIIRLKSLFPWSYVTALGIIFSLWMPQVFGKYYSDSQPDPDTLLLNCAIADDSPTSFTDYQLETFLYEDEGRGEYIASFPAPNAESQTNYHPVPSEFKGLVTFFVECKITNISDKNVSLEYVRSFLLYRVSLKNNQEAEERKLSYEGAFQGVYRNYGTELAFPILLQQGEQVVVLVKVGWLINQRSLDPIKEIYRNAKEAITLAELYTLLKDSGTGTKLNENGAMIFERNTDNEFYLPIMEWNDPRLLGIVAKSGEGTKFYFNMFVP